MLKPSTTSRCAIITLAAFVFMLIGSPAKSNADEKQWRDKSKDLPLLSPGKVILMGVIGVVVIGLVIYASKDKKKEKEKEEEKKDGEEKKEENNGGQAAIFSPPQFSSLNGRCLSGSESEEWQERPLQEQEKIPFSVYVGVSDNDYKDTGAMRFDSISPSRTIVLGVTLSF
jgi:hypothetical protein